MGQEVEFPQRWELRTRRDDSESSSGTSGSSSKSDQVFKKLKLINLIPIMSNGAVHQQSSTGEPSKTVQDLEVAVHQPSYTGVQSKTVENTELDKATVHQQSNAVQSKTVEDTELAEAAVHQQSYTGAQSTTGKVRRVQTGRSNKCSRVQNDGEKPHLIEEKSKKPNSVQGNSKKRNSVHHTARGSCKEIQRKRKITTSPELAVLDELKLFRETLLEDLQVAKEKLLIHMKEEINKLVSGNSATQLTRRQEDIREKDILVTNQNFKMNIQDQFLKIIDNNVQAQGQSRHKNNKGQGSNQSDKGIKVQAEKFKSSSRFHKCDGESSKPGNGKKVASDRLSQAVRTPPVEEKRGRRSKLPVKPVIQLDSFGRGYKVHGTQTFDPNSKLPKSNCTVQERSSEGKNTVEVSNIPHYLENNLDNVQDIRQLTSNEKNVGPCSMASNILSNPCYQNGLLQHQVNAESCMKLLDSTGGSFVQGKMTGDSANCPSRVLEEQLIYGQIAGAIPQNVRDAVERYGRNYLSNPAGQVGPSILPPFLSGPQLENLRQDSPCNYMQQPSGAGNAMVENPNSTDLMMNTSVFNRLFPVMGESARSLRTDSLNKNSPNHNRKLASGNGTGFAIPIHRRIENSLLTSKDPGQNSLDNSPQTTDNIDSPQTNKRASLASGGRNVSSGHQNVNNFQKPLIQETSGGLISVSSPYSKEGT